MMHSEVSPYNPDRRLKFASDGELERATADLQRSFRVNFTIFIALFCVFANPVVQYQQSIPVWFINFCFVAILVAVNGGHVLGGAKGTGLGIGICGILLCFVGCLLGNGFFTMQMTAFYLFPNLLAVFVSWKILLPFMVLNVLTISGLYFMFYHTGNYIIPANYYPYEVHSWRLVSIVLLIAIHVACAYVIPYCDRLRDTPVLKLQSLGKEIREATEDMKRATVAARDSLASYSHEVRTPLNVIHAMAETLLRSGEIQLKGQHESLIRLLHSAAQQLLLISNNVLDISAMWAGALTIHHTRFRLKSLLEDCVALATTAAESRGVKIVCSSVSSQSEWFSSDEGRLKQILFNILDHLLRKSNSGSVLQVHVAVDERNDTKSTLKLVFGNSQDTTTLTQASQSLSLPQGAVGDHVDTSSASIGMYVARKLTQALGGQLRVKLDPRYDFMQEMDHPKVVYCMHVPLEPVTHVMAGEKSVQILYAEDEPANQFVMKTLLKGTNHKLTIANNGIEAVKMFEEGQGKYDFVLLDMNMPVMGGVCAAAAMRRVELEQNYSKRAWIAYISAAPVTKEDIEGGGVDSVLQKPTTKAQLFALLDSTITSPAGYSASSPLLSQRSSNLLLNSKSVLHSILWPSHIPLLRVAKYHSALFLAITSMITIATHVYFGSRPATWRAFVLVGSFWVHPLLLLSDRLYTRVAPFYTPLQFTGSALFLSVRETGFDTFYLHSSYAAVLAMAIGASKWTLISTSALLSTCALGLYYVQEIRGVSFPVQFTEHELAMKLAGVWIVFSIINTAWNMWCHHLRLRAYREVIAANYKLSELRISTQHKHRAMSDLAKNVSYDIRTPLNVVLGITDRLQSITSLPASVRRSTGILDTACGMLLLLLDNTVDAKRVASGDQLPLEVCPVDLRSLAKRVCTMMAFYARGKRLQLLVRVEKSVPLAVIGDPLRLQQVAVNLLTNAIKFTTTGQVVLTIENLTEKVGVFEETVASSAVGSSSNEDNESPPTQTREISIAEPVIVSSLRRRSNGKTKSSPLPLKNTLSDIEMATAVALAKQPSSKSLLGSTSPSMISPPSGPSVGDPARPNIRISVTDTGPGIEPDKCDLIFQKFEAGVSSETRKNRGTGLGLFISRAIVEKCGGTISVDSIVGQGTSFSCILPMEVCSQSDSDNESSDNDPLTRALRILVVEDAAEMQTIMRLFLADTAHTVEFASTAQKGIEMFDSRPYDVVLLDQHLPDMAGSELVRILRSHTLTSSFPSTFSLLSSPRIGVPHHRSVLIAAVTADTSETAKRAAYDAGCDDFLAKPLSRADLMTLLHKKKHSNALVRRGSTTASNPGTPNTHPNIRNLDRLNSPVSSLPRSDSLDFEGSESHDDALGRKLSVSAVNIILSGEDGEVATSLVEHDNFPIEEEELEKAAEEKSAKHVVLIPFEFYDFVVDEYVPRLTQEFLDLRSVGMSAREDTTALHTVREVAHRVKGSAATLGLVKLDGLCQRLMYGASDEVSALVEETLTMLENAEYRRDTPL